MKTKRTVVAAGLIAVVSTAWQTPVHAADAVPVLPFDKVCAFEKHKKLMFDGYLDLQKMSCKGTRNKRTNKISNAECSIVINATARPAAKGGAPLTAWVSVVDGDKLPNRMHWPADKYKAEDLKIHDSAGTPVPVRNKLRLTGTLRKTDDCQFSVSQIETAK
jgi:hypothetical protein